MVKNNQPPETQMAVRITPSSDINKGPGLWQHVTLDDGARWAAMSCPNCGSCSLLPRDGRVARDGFVETGVKCSNILCGFVGLVFLTGWDLGDHNVLDLSKL